MSDAEKPPAADAARWTVGQEVGVVTLHGVIDVSEIVKLGRKWGTLARYGHRFDLTTGAIDGGAYSSPGRVYPSRREAVAVSHHSSIAGDVFQRITRSRLEALSPADLRTLAGWVGVTVLEVGNEP